MSSWLWPAPVKTGRPLMAKTGLAITPILIISVVSALYSTSASIFNSAAAFFTVFKNFLQVGQPEPKTLID